MSGASPFGAGNGPGEKRSFGGRRWPPKSNGSSSPRRSDGPPRASKLTADDVDALFAAVGRVRFVAFDFETTGLDAVRERVVEIGAIAFRMECVEGAWQAAVEGSYETLVNPGRPIPPAVSAIHGIDDLAVSGSPSFAAAAVDFFPFIEGSILIAHNAPFDMGFLKAEAVRCGIEIPANPVYDTIAIAKTAISGLPSYSLKSLSASFSIAQNAAHRGADDARVCMELFARCVSLLDKYK